MDQSVLDHFLTVSRLGPLTHKYETRLHTSTIAFCSTKANYKYLSLIDNDKPGRKRKFNECFSLISILRREKNVLKSFKVESNGSADSYSVDTVLKSLGELEKVADKKHGKSKMANGKATVVNGTHHNNNGGVAKSGDRSDEKLIGDKKSTSDDEASTDVSSNYSSTVEFNHIQGRKL